MTVEDLLTSAGSSSTRSVISDASIILAVSCIPAITCIGLTSDISPLGGHIYEFLGDLHGRSCLKMYAEIGACLLLVSYLLDAQLPFNPAPWSYVAASFLAAGAVCFIASLLCLTYWAPSVPILVGAFFTLVPVLVLRSTVYKCTSSQGYSFRVAVAFATLSVFIGMIWVMWAFSVVFGPANWPWYTEVNKTSFENPLLAEYVLWLSPMISALLYACIALLAALRSQVHLPDNPDEPMDERSRKFVHGELRGALLCIAVMMLLMWIAASTVLEGTFSKSIERIALAILAGAVVYLLHTLGISRITGAAKSSAAIRYSLDLVQSDWVMSLALMLALPVLPLFLLLSIVHQLARKLITGNDNLFSDTTQAEDVLKRKPYLTYEGNVFLDFAGARSWTSIVTKCNYLGIALFVLQVLFGQGVYVFLVWLNDSISSWSLYAILAILFSVGLFLFLLPPVPGVPIYILAGNLVTEKCSKNGLGFGTALVLAVTFSFALKMVSIVMQQKAIGAPLSSNVSVKQLVGIHTPPMKATRHILNQNGLRISKVAVLVGGPDWPVSVLTGIMGLPVSQMLLGSTPVLFLVAPFALTSCFAAQAHKEENLKDQEMYMYYSSVFLVASSFVLVSAMTIAGYFIQEALENNIDAMDSGEFEKDPQEDLILEKVKMAEKEAESLQRQTSWLVLPIYLRCVLVLGVLFASALSLILIFPFEEDQRPFKQFTLSNTMEDIPGGILDLVQPLGWVCTALTGACCSAAAIFQVWCAVCVTKSHVDETTPLVDKST